MDIDDILIAILKEMNRGYQLTDNEFELIEKTIRGNVQWDTLNSLEDLYHRVRGI